MNTLKQIIGAAFGRIEFIEDLCLIKKHMKTCWTLTAIENHQAESDRMSARENLLIEKIALVCPSINQSFKHQFQLLSESLFKNWESSFGHKCINKGNLKEIVQLYLRFFKFIGEPQAVDYISEMALHSKSQSSTVFLLIDCVFKVLLQLTTKTLESIRNQQKALLCYRPKDCTQDRNISQATRLDYVFPNPSITSSPFLTSPCPESKRKNLRHSFATEQQSIQNPSTISSRKPLFRKEPKTQKIKGSQPQYQEYLAPYYKFHDGVLDVQEIKLNDGKGSKSNYWSKKGFEEILGVLLAGNRLIGQNISLYQSLHTSKCARK